MTVREKINLIKQTQIYKLVFEGQIRGFRLSMYNDDIESLEYYDFIIEDVQDESIKDYIREHIDELKELQLVMNGDYLETKAEQGTVIKVRELNQEQTTDFTKKAIEIINEVRKCTK